MPSVKSYCYHSCENLFKFSFPPLFTTLVLYDSWTGGILNAQYLLLLLEIFKPFTCTCRGIITAPSHAKLKVRYPPHGITAHAWGDPYAHTCTSLCSPNGQPAIQAKYIYSTLLPAFLFGCVAYASATLVTDFTRSL